jgi:hypothetical protein
MKTNSVISAILLFMVFLFMGNTMLFAQQTFSYIIPPDTITPDGRVPTAWGTSVVALDSGKLMLVESRYQNPDSVYRETMIRIFNTTGEEIHSKRYALEGKSWNNNDTNGTIVKLENGEIMLYNLIIDYDGQNLGTWYSSFMKLDQNGDSLWFRLYDLGDFEQFHGMVKTQDTGVIVAGYHRERGDENPRQPLVVKVDQNGDTVWTHKESYPGRWHYTDIATNGLEYMLVGNWEYDYISSGSEEYYQGISTTLLERGPFTYPHRYWGDIGESTYGQLVIPYLNFGFLMLTIEPGMMLRHSFSLRDKQKLRRLDYEGKELWVQDIAFENTFPIRDRFVRIISSLPNGDIILAGNVSIGDKPVYIQRRTEQGMVLWERWLSVCDQCNHDILDLEVLPDGYAISGTVVTPDQGQRAFIMRTDSTGCLEPGCPDRQGPFVSAEPENGLGRIAVFPNPAQSTVFVNATKNPVKVDIFDVHGKKVLFSQKRKKHQINLELLPSGMYFYRAMDRDGRSLSGKFVKE